MATTIPLNFPEKITTTTFEEFIPFILSVSCHQTEDCTSEGKPPMIIQYTAVFKGRSEMVCTYLNSDKSRTCRYQLFDSRENLDESYFEILQEFFNSSCKEGIVIIDRKSKFYSYKAINLKK